MKILYITQYFYPEIGAPSNRALANVRFLSQKGHNLTILTEIPNHPKGIIFDGYKHKILVREKMENFIINRVWVFTTKKKNFITRILFYISFMLIGFIHTLFNWKKYDVIYITSPPIFVGVIGLWLKKIFLKTKFVLEVRDLWPKSAIDIGELNNPTLIKFSEKLEKRIYSVADKVISLTKGIDHYINNCVPEKSIIITNGVDLNIFKTVEKRDDRFIIVYAGTLGLIHSVNTIIETAEILKDKTNMLFQFIGDGVKKKEMENLVKIKNLDNVEFLDSVPLSEIKKYLSKASIGISSTRKIELCKGTLPAKVFGYMACELPVLLSGWGESDILIHNANCGMCVEPEDSAGLAKKILWMVNHPKERVVMGKKGRKFVEKYYNREKQAEELEKELIKLLENK